MNRNFQDSSPSHSRSPTKSNRNPFDLVMLKENSHENNESVELRYHDQHYRQDNHHYDESDLFLRRR